jgi:hypothetical protein
MAMTAVDIKNGFIAGLLDRGILAVDFAARAARVL